jgi:hypothetical protein
MFWFSAYNEQDHDQQQLNIPNIKVTDKLINLVKRINDQRLTI